jgi:phosphoenolpyruvate-protein kinase (PTS system EI component)
VFWDATHCISRCPSCFQIRAIIGASLELLVEGVEVVPRILVPMVCTAHELEAVTALINKVAGQVTRTCFCVGPAHLK